MVKKNLKKFQTDVVFFVVVIGLSLLLSSCGCSYPVDKAEINLDKLIGFVNIDVTEPDPFIKYEVNHDFGPNASAAQFCIAADKLFNDGGCAGKKWDECAFWDFQADDVFYFNNTDFNTSVQVICAQTGLFDLCAFGHPSSFTATIRLCDNDTDCKIQNPNEILIDLRKAGLSKNCTKILGITTGSSCGVKDRLVLYTDNNFEGCDPNDPLKVCYYGKCTNRSVCNPNGELDPGEKCDPQGQLFRMDDGSIKNGYQINCSDFGLVSEDGAKPECSEDCIININDYCTADPTSLLCGDYELEEIKTDEITYVEECDWRSEDEIVKYDHPDGTKHEKTLIFKTKSFCAQESNYFGDASKLDCVINCKISREPCDIVQTAEQKEENCGDNVNKDYWYDLYVEPEADRTRYIANNYLDDQGYFSEYEFDEEKCYNKTRCEDCYDIDCDGKLHGEYHCNFKQERMCNDGYDNDGDGKTDGEDEDCSYDERFNPDLSEEGLCHLEDSCYHESQLSCVDNEKLLPNSEKWYICNKGYWENEIKLLAELILEEFSNKNKFLIYCNDGLSPDSDPHRKGYVLDLNSKIGGPGSDETVGEFFNHQSTSSYGKFCAAKSEEGDEKYIIGTVLKNPEETEPKKLFCDDPTSCDDINNYEKKLERCGNNQIFLNGPTGLFVKTNLFADKNAVEFIQDTTTVNELIKSLKEAATHLNSDAISQIEKSGAVEAFALKKNNEKEVLGAIVTVNSTAHTIILIKTKDFEDICNSINNNDDDKKIYINNQQVKCHNRGDSNSFVIAWSVNADESIAMDISKQKFDELIKNIKI